MKRREISAIIPKSIAAIERKLADSPRIAIIPKADIRLIGTAKAAIKATFKSPKKINMERKTKIIPIAAILDTLCITVSTSFPLS